MFSVKKSLGIVLAFTVVLMCFHYISLQGKYETAKNSIGRVADQKIRLYSIKGNCPYAPSSKIAFVDTEELRSNSFSFDSGFGQALIHYLRNKKVIDIEANLGQFKSFVASNDGKFNISLKSFESSTNSQKLVGQKLPLKDNSEYTVPEICWFDNSAMLNKSWRFDWVMAIEYSETSRRNLKSKSVFLDNLATLSNEGIILSWGLHDHNKNATDIIKQMKLRGFNFDAEQTAIFRKSVTTKPHSHLKQTLMVFKCCNLYIPDIQKLKTCRMSPPHTQGSQGGWQYTRGLIQSQHVKFDQPLGKALIKFLDNKEIVDIGAGVGQMEALFIKEKANVKWSAFDGGINIQDFHGQKVALRDDPNHVVPKVCWLDASVVLNKNWRYDWAVSIEVGEHIPKQFESIFIDNLVSLGKEGIIVSWAVLGQAGYNHVNTQSNEYIIKQMEKRGAHYDKNQTMIFRKTASIWWLKNSLMVFRKK